MEENHSKVTTKPSKKGSLWNVLKVVLIVGLIGAIAGLGYLYYTTRQQLQFLSSQAGQEELAKREVSQVVDALDNLAILPDEEPVVATITDHEALATQSAFYVNAVNGDKLVVFPQAKQAFIYSPSRAKIVNVGPLLVEEAPVGENAGGATEAVGAKSIKIEVRNGSATTGKGTATSTQLKALARNLEVTTVADAANKDYQESLVVSSKPELADAAQQIAKSLNARVVSAAPTGEAASQADILVIVGN